LGDQASRVAEQVLGPALFVEARRP
jgi:hypothetical protein